MIIVEKTEGEREIDRQLDRHREIEEDSKES